MEGALLSVSEITFPDTCLLKTDQAPSQPSFPLVTHLHHTPEGPPRLKALLQAASGPGPAWGLSASPWPARWPHASLGCPRRVGCEQGRVSPTDVVWNKEERGL